MKTLSSFIIEAKDKADNLITVWEGDDKLGGDFDKMFAKLNKYVHDNGYMFFIHGEVPGQEVNNWAEDWDETLKSAYMPRNEKFNSYKCHSVELDTKKNCLVLNMSFRPSQNPAPTHEVRVWLFNKETADYFKLDCGVTVGSRNSSFTNPKTGEHVFNASKLPPLCDAPFINCWGRPHKTFATGMTKKQYVVPASEILSVIG